MRPRGLLLLLLAIHAAPLRAQAAGEPASAGPPRVRLGLAWLPLPFAVRLDADPRLAPPAPRLPTWPGTPPGGPEFPPPAAPTAPQAAPQPASPASPAPQPQPQPQPQAFLQRYADLGVVVDGRSELGGEWTRFRPCDPTSRVPCDPGALPQLRPRMQFGVRAAGTVSDRVHVDVDYDQRREFDAANNINLYYQGLPGEFLRRVEVGDVSFALPSSRYLTEGVPGGNFGFRASAGAGPLSLDAVFARQKGDVTTRELTLGGPGRGGVAQEVDAVVDDADYVKGQFFFVVDPRALPGYPHVDALALRPSDAPAAQRPAAGTAVVVYRDERPSLTSPEQQAQLGYFLAQATTAGAEQTHSGLFRRLVPGVDYLLHSSGLWLVLRSPLRPDEALAVGYVTEAGDTVGALVTPTAGGATPTLRLIRPPEPEHRPGLPSWDYEMHQVYRVDASSRVDPSTVELDVSLGQPGAGASFVTAPDGTQVPLLRLFGLDDDAPLERLDPSRIYQPGGGAGSGFGGVAGLDSGAGVVGGSGLAGTGDVRVGGTYVVFPTLRPFAEPPPTATLSAADAATALGTQANAAIYDDADPTTRAAAARFRLGFHYAAPAGEAPGTFSLGALGVREGSERLTLGGRTLRRGVDYTIDYDLGRVTLTDPAALAAAGGAQALHATFEQKAAFDVAPTTLGGLTARYELGRRGELDVVGLYRAEQALQTRPQLGLEPAALMMGGVSGSVELGGAWLERAVSALSVGGAGAAPASLRLSGELAVSMPNPNTHGDTYVDDFETADALPLSLARPAWSAGSRPGETTGAEAELPAAPDAADAAPLVWQHEFSQGGQVVGALPAAAIDSVIRVSGAAVREPVLYLSFGGAPVAGAPPPGGRLWSAITTPLGPSGRDLSQTEYLEFYAAAPSGRDLALVLDLGTISEDAFHVDSTGATSGVLGDGTPWGLGVLDQEARAGQGEVWGPEQDARGLWGEVCRAEPGQSYPLGDPRAVCTRDNGMVDTEDLDGDGFLQPSDGPHLRWVVPLERASAWEVRDESQTRTGFRLYRIPLRAGLALGGAGDATLRDARDLRITVTGTAGADAVIRIARLRLVGSRWTKRRGTGVLRGVVGDEAGLGAAGSAVRVGQVGRVADGGSYVSPPGVRDALQDPTSAYGLAAIQHDEQSLRVAFDALEADDRAEVYFRWPQQPRNLLSYRELRLWALAARAPAGADLELLVKVGTDESNYYLWRGPLRPPAAAAPTTDDWLPERVIDFGPWLRLRARAEEQLAARGPSDPPLVLWSDDSTYAVVLQDRARAPNLAAVRELSFAVHNAGQVAVDGEVWLDELRLGGAARDAGVAGRLDLRLQAGDVLSATASFSHRGARYQQLRRTPDYQGAADWGVSGTARLDRIGRGIPALEMPLRFELGHTALSPLFLQQSDVPAAGLPDLRPTGDSRLRLDLLVRAAADSGAASPLDGLALRLGYASASGDRLLGRDRSRSLDAGLSWDWRPRPATLLGSALRWSPESLHADVGWHDAAQRTWRFEQALAVPGQPAPAPVRAPVRGLDERVGVSLRPLPSLGASLDVRSGRDLLRPDELDAAPLQREVVARERRRIAGLDLGWERDRDVSTRAEWRPAAWSWLQPSLRWSSGFRTRRTPSLLEVQVLGADTLAAMRRGLSAERELTRALRFVPEALLAAGDDGAAPDAGGASVLAAVARRVVPVDIAWTRSLASRFDRGADAPGLAYQLGWGGLGAFSRVGGDTAAAALRRDLLRLRSGVRLALGAELDAAWTAADADVRNFGAARTQRDRTWPDLRLAWPALPLPGWAASALARASLSAGYQRLERRETLTGGDGEVRRTTRRGIPVELDVVLAGGVSAGYAAQLGSGRGSDATGASRAASQDHTLRVAGSFDAPAALRDRFPRPFRLELGYRYRSQRECRLAAAADAACVPYIDLLTRGLQLTLQTTLSQLDVGFQMSYDDRQSAIGTRNGTGQLQLGLFAQFHVSAGEMPAAAMLPGEAR